MWRILGRGTSDGGLVVGTIIKPKQRDLLPMQTPAISAPPPVSSDGQADGTSPPGRDARRAQRAGGVRRDAASSEVDAHSGACGGASGSAVGGSG
eukprot:10391443-Alexandrium_andersonii.AAC.1